MLNMCKKIKKAGCNVIFVQKSILRDAVNDLSLHFLAKLKIMVVKDIERDEVEFICKVSTINQYEYQHRCIDKLIYLLTATFIIIMVYRVLVVNPLLMLNRSLRINWVQPILSRK